MDHAGHQRRSAIQGKARRGPRTAPAARTASAGERHDRVCPAGAAPDMADRLPDAALVVFENSAHMTFAEEPDSYRAAVRGFLGQITG